MKKRQDHPALQRGRTTEGRRTVKTRTNNIVSYPGNRAVGQKRKYSRPTASSRSERLAVKKRVSKGSTVNKHTLGNKVPPLYIWGDFDVPFLLLTLALLGFGLVMMFSASYARAYYDFDNSFYFIGRQIVWSMIGITGMIAASFVNYHWLRRFVWPLYFVSIVLCMACYLFDAYNGARRSIYIGPLSFQPSEIGKLALIFLFAHLMTKDQDKMGRLWEGTLRYLVLFGRTCSGCRNAAALSGNLADGRYYSSDAVCRRSEDPAPDRGWCYRTCRHRCSGCYHVGLLL